MNTETRILFWTRQLEAIERRIADAQAATDPQAPYRLGALESERKFLLKTVQAMRARQ